jgi:signal transduction histidine kinase
MHRIKPVLLLFFTISFLSSRGEQPITWYSQDFLLKNGVFKNYGLVTEPMTFGVEFINNTNQTRTYYLKINNPHINRLYVFNAKHDTLFITGDRFQFNSRPIYFWEFIFPIQVKPNSIDSLRFQVHKKGENLSFHTLLIAEKDYDKIHDRYLYFYSTFVSISVFLLLGFIFLGFYKNESKHYLFAAFIFFSAGWALNERGIFFQYLWPNNINLHERIDTFFATPSVGLLLFILFFNETYKNLIGRKIKSVLIFFLVFLIARIILVLFYSALSDNASLKLFLLNISNTIVIFMILFFIVNLIRFGTKRILFLDTIGFIVYFAFLLNLALKQNNLNFLLPERFYGFAYPLMQTFTISIFSVSNYMKHRSDRRSKLENEKLLAIQREKEMTEKIIAVQENERESIGRNIHDQIGGLLAAAKIKLQTMKLKNADDNIKGELEQIISIMDRSSTEIYHIVDELVPPIMRGETLFSIIQSRVELLEKSTDIQFKINIEPVFIEQNLLLKLYRIISELITNSIKHAKCKNISINFTQHKNGYTLDYIDDGIGFDNNMQRNHGINNIESRVNYLEGRIDFLSVSGKTHYSIHIPHSKNEE